MDKPTESSYKGHPTLIMPDPDDPRQPGIAMGLTKLRAVINSAEEVKAFIAKHTKAHVEETELVELRAKIAALQAKLKGQ